MQGHLMDEVQREKYDFTRTTLTNLLRQTLHNAHSRAEDAVSDSGTGLVDETVDEELNVRTIDVTADSLLALTRGVLKTF